MMLHAYPFRRVLLVPAGRPVARLHRRDARGFALVEAVISVLLVGLLFVSALRVVAASRMSEATTSHRAIGRELAVDLLSEILLCAYEEPTDVPSFGRETGEPADPRAAWDDVDDFHGYVDAPVSAANGTPLADLDNWSRQVEVDFVQPANPDLPSANDLGVKRITVAVRRQGRIVGRASALRTVAWKNPLPEPEGVTDNQPPLAVAAADRLVISQGQTVNFDGRGSSDPDSDPLTYYWDFGDGDDSGGATVSHRFVWIGTFTVTLTVSDGLAMDTDLLVVEVQ